MRAHLAHTPSLKRVRPPEKEDIDQEQMAKNNVVSANPTKSESLKPKTYKKAKLQSLYDTPEAQCSVLERANELAASLAPEFPSLVRIMLPSHVTRVFWLGIPRKFCRDHMPKDDIMIVLEDENGEEYQTKYLVEKEGLSGGWRAFSVSHKLQEGDAVVFHKVMPSKFKVYIIRSNGSDRVESSLGINKFDDAMGQTKTKVVACESSRNGKLEPVAVETMHANDVKENTVACNTKYGHSEVLDGKRVSESVIPFKDASCFENFKVIVGGSIINAEISKHHLIKYYELCRSQNSFLHEQILEPLNSNLVAGIISETVNLSDAIRACKITTSECDFTTWDKTLEASEILGMNVGFLRSRLDKLASLASTSKLNREAILARDQAVKDLITLGPKFLRGKEVKNKLNLEIETLNTSSEKLEAMFKEVAMSPW